MAITLTPEIQAKLQERASRSGQDASALAEAVLQAYLDHRVEVIPPEILHIADDDAAGIDAAIVPGDDDFAAGRFRSLDEWRAKKQERFGFAP